MATQTDRSESKGAPVVPSAPRLHSGPDPERSRSERRSARRTPAILATLIVVAIVGLSLWYLAQPQPLLVQGEADATRIDIAARVDGRVGKRPVERGDNVAAGQVLYEIDNPELLTKLREAEASLAVASANLANIEAGTRAEDIAQRKAAQESAAAQLTLAQQTYARVKELAGSGNAPLQRLDEATDSLKTAQSAAEQAKFAYDEAVAGPTKEQRDIARANVAEAQASVNSIRAQVDELVVKAPI
jgi:HlyD family secretion protein